MATADEDWMKLLTRFSAELIGVDSIRAELSPDVIASNWLGFDGASEAEIAECEARLGVSLPPSYREFLRVSNGWRTTGPFVSRLFSTAEVRWLRDVDRELIEIWRESAGEDSPERDLEHCLAVSPYDDAICLLNSKRVNSNGEWDAWFFADWVPGAHKFRSFLGMFRHLRKNVREQLKEQKQGEAADPSLPSTMELLQQLGAFWPEPWDKRNDAALRVLQMEVRDPQRRWNVVCMFASVRMTAEQDAEFRRLVENDRDPKVRNIGREILAARENSMFPLTDEEPQ